MPVSEHELRDLMRERSDAVPATPELAHRVQQRVRRRRRLEAGGVAAGLVLVLVATGLVALPRREASGPAAAPAPTHRSTQVLGTSLVVTTEGPTRIEGGTPFEVTLEMDNTSTGPWTGSVGVGIAADGDIPGLLGENSLLTIVAGQGSGFTTQTPAAVADPSNPQQLQGASLDRITLEPGQDRTWTWTMKRWTRGSVLGEVLGWIPWATPAKAGSEGMTGAVGAAVPITVTPRTSSLACDTVTITSASVGKPGPWQVMSARTARVGADLAATWTPVEVPDAPMFDVTSDSDARDGTVVAAVAAFWTSRGIDGPVASAYGPEEFAADATEGAPGRYVSYSGTRMVPVTFAGTCGPSGRTISGTWTAYEHSGGGVLNCSLVPPAGSMGEDARRFCPS